MANDIMIDDFTSGEYYSKTLVPGDRAAGVSETGLDPAHTIGGERGFWLDSCMDFGTMPVEHDPTAGTWSTGGTPGSRCCEGPSFFYGQTYYGSNPLNVNLLSAGITGVRVTIDILDPGQPNLWYDPVTEPSYVEMTFFTSGIGQRRDYGTSWMTTLLPTTISQTSIVLPLSSLMSDNYEPVGVDLTDVDGIHVWYGGLGDGSHIVIREMTFVTGLDGDLNGDGFVGIEDLNTVLGVWDQSAPLDNPTADANGDGFVGIEDLNVVLGNWNAGEPPAAGAHIIPEPAVGIVFLAAGLSLIRRRV